MKDKKIIILIISLIIFIGIGVYFLLFNSQSDKSYTYDEFTINKGSIGELKEYNKTMYFEGYEGDYTEAYYINGSMTNNGSNNYKFILITFNLYDKNNNLLGTAIAGINNVEGNKTYEFTAMSLTTTENAKKIVKYDLKSIKEI